MNPNPVVVEFDNRLAEHLAAERLYHRSTFWWKGDKVVAVAMGAMGLYLLGTVGVRWWTVVWFPVALLEWFNLLSVRPLQVRFFFNRNPKLRERYRLSFADDGIHFKTQSIDSTIAWTHYTRLLENNALVLLLYGTGLYTVIPKRAFVDEEDLARFMLLVRKHVRERAAVGA